MNKMYGLLLLFLFPYMLWSHSDEDKYILVTGGAGYIGSYVNEILYRQGHSTIVLDNLCIGNRQAVEHGIFIEGDIGDKELLHKIFASYPIKAVMHFAANTDVGESVNNPLKYYNNNVSSSLSLIEEMIKHKINNFIFSSSAAVYGYAQSNLILENHPCSPISPYGKTKLMIETLLQDTHIAHSFNYCCLRYFNVTGGDPEGKLKNYKKFSKNLIATILNNLLAENYSITINGTDYPTPDGTCIRDYIHIEDLANAHLAAMNHLLSGGSSGSYNIGNGIGYSVREVIEAAKKATGKNIVVIEGARRPGDPPTSIANPEKAKKELKWEPQYTSLETMIKHAWDALQF